MASLHCLHRTLCRGVSCHWQSRQGILFGMLLAACCWLPFLTATAQEFELDPSLMPPPESRQDADTAVKTTTSPSPPLSSQQMFLQGKITTLEAALKEESKTVDWYAWYLACRDYLIETRGLHCSLGTPLRIYKNGRFQAITSDPVCQASAASKYFPLPEKTVLKAILLPIRGQEDAPASRAEIDMRTQSSQ